VLLSGVIYNPKSSEKLIIEVSSKSREVPGGITVLVKITKVLVELLVGSFCINNFIVALLLERTFDIKIDLIDTS